ncbi:MAG: hypothetical protein LUE92_05595 [Clostridiales bacterium]|nr:hypothetical protein [Clostridiales bacterium]
MANEMAPFYQTVDVEFVWNRGLAKSQKQKNVKAIHEEFLKQQRGKRVLEIGNVNYSNSGIVPTGQFRYCFIIDSGRCGMPTDKRLKTHWICESYLGKYKNSKQLDKFCFI